MQTTKILTVAVLLLVGITGTTGIVSAQTSDGSAPDASLTSLYELAVANPERTDADRERDAGRKPAQVLEFFGIKPGMTVLDMFSGGGYYTELLSYVVGTEGKVVAHTNSAYAGFVGDEAVNRYAGNRLLNVEHLLAENNELRLRSEVFDAVMLILSYHDIYYVDEANNWPKIDGPKMLAELMDSLKPGGILGVVDHSAAPGSPRETGGTLHRIDPQIVISELEAAGFAHVAEADFLRNTADDHSKAIFNPEVRGRTDRFVLKFRKPDIESAL
jgi:predicted methyltransferase